MSRERFELVAVCNCRTCNIVQELAKRPETDKIELVRSKKSPETGELEQGFSHKQPKPSTKQYVILCLGLLGLLIYILILVVGGVYLYRLRVEQAAAMARERNSAAISWLPRPAALAMAPDFGKNGTSSKLVPTI